MQGTTIIKLLSVIEPKFQREFNVRETLGVLTHDVFAWGSWGVTPTTLTNLRNQCLVFKPNGRYFKGFVCITLGWEDLYQVHFVSNDYKLKKTVEGVYFDMLFDVIDGEIETR